MSEDDVEHDEHKDRNVRQRKSPMSKPEMLNVTRLEQAREVKRRGRPKKLIMPPLPQEIFDGMTDLERQHFDFFVETFKQRYGIEEGSDLISLNLAAFDYIQVLRVQAEQMKSGQIISMARQHPAVQLRAWLDQMDVTRKANKTTRNDKDDKSEEIKDWVKKLSS